MSSGAVRGGAGRDLGDVRVKSPKLQRWIDLLAALLRRRFPVTFEELTRTSRLLSPARTRPRSAAPSSATRTSSRLRHSHRDRDRSPRRNSATGSSPALLSPVSHSSLATGGQAEEGGQVRLPVLPTLAFEPDELSAVAEPRPGCASWAIRSSPSRPTRPSGSSRVICRWTPRAPRSPPWCSPGQGPPELLATLAQALEKRKRVTFTYHGMGDGESAAPSSRSGSSSSTSTGISLPARPARDGQELPGEPNREHQRERRDDPTPRLRDPRRLRPPGPRPLPPGLGAGAGDAIQAVVHFRPRLAPRPRPFGWARRCGSPRTRRFRVRRTDAFARWLLSFGGDIVPVSPARAGGRVPRPGPRNFGPSFSRPTARPRRLPTDRP